MEQNIIIQNEFSSIIKQSNFQNMFISILRSEFESGLTEQHQMTAKIKSEGINEFGAKMGKTEKGAVWLNEKLFSPYDYWQFWRNSDDKDVYRFLRFFMII